MREQQDIAWALASAGVAVTLALGLLGLGILYQQGVTVELGAVATASSANVEEPVRSAIPPVGAGLKSLDLDLSWGRRWLLIFGTVFVAEMGDKTQLATLLMSAQSPSPWGIFLGSAGALVLASLLSVVLGEGLAQVLPRDWLQLIAGVGFVVIGFYVLWDAKQ